VSAERFVSAGGRRLRVRSLGSWCAADPVLVLLHEGLGSIGQWRDFPDALCEATRLPALVYDRYGHGGSERLDSRRAPDFLVEEARHALVDLLAACGVGRAVLFGHSDGGTIALLHAALAGTGPVAVVTEAAHVMMETATLRALGDLQARWQVDGELRRRIGRHHGAGTDAMVANFIDTRLDPGMADWRMTDLLPAIRCPVLAMQGEDDAHGTRAQVEAIVSGVSGPAAGLLVPSCGHVPHRERADVILAATAAFVHDVLEGHVPEGAGEVRTAPPRP